MASETTIQYTCDRCGITAKTNANETVVPGWVQLRVNDYTSRTDWQGDLCPACNRILFNPEPIPDPEPPQNRVTGPLVVQDYELIDTTNPSGQVIPIYPIEHWS